MKRKFSLALLSITLIFSILIMNSCNNSDDTMNCTPRINVSVTLLPNEMNNLQTQFWTYVIRDGAGTNGIIVAKTNNSTNGSGYVAYDRNPPHICPDGESTKLVVESSKIVCPKDGAEWFLINGAPIKISPRALVPINCEVNGGTISINYWN